MLHYIILCYIIRSLLDYFSFFVCTFKPRPLPYVVTHVPGSHYVNAYHGDVAAALVTCEMEPGAGRNNKRLPCLRVWSSSSGETWTTGATPTAASGTSPQQLAHSS